jgi:hypothetical protein
VEMKKEVERKMENENEKMKPRVGMEGKTEWKRK